MDLREVIDAFILASRLGRSMCQCGTVGFKEIVPKDICFFGRGNVLG